MAKKKIAQEDCMICGQHPCVCEGEVRRTKHLRLLHTDTDDRRTVIEPEGGDDGPDTAA